MLVLLGVWIALHEDWAKRHRFLVLASFVIAGFAWLYMTRQQSRQSSAEVAEAQKQAAEANTKLSNTLEKINNQIDPNWQSDRRNLTSAKPEYRVTK